MASATKTPSSKSSSSSSSLPKGSTVSKVRVIVRVRPFLPNQLPNHPTPCASAFNAYSEEEVTTVHLKDQATSRNECYKLDSFYGQDDNNVSQIFEKEVSPLIPGLFGASNATVFAYGATGSGKTYTMQGGNEHPGLVHMAMSMILSVCHNTRGTVAEISYYEVYMDRCYDLLQPKTKEIAVLDDKDGEVHLKGLGRLPIHSMSEFHEAFSCAIQRRKVAHTGINDVSSRSHGVLVICVSTPCHDSTGNVVIGKLNLIDLAGNEDNRRTGNEGIRLQESAKINQSLFALSNVIYALNNSSSRVPYRESKLTRILQDSLGGRSRALMIACLNPGEYQESVYTVRLAARSRHISNFVSSAQKQETPKIKVDMEEKLRSWLESKGKSTSVKKIGAFNSPFVSRTPSSSRCIKKPDMNQQSSTKLKAVKNIRASNLKERSLTLPHENLSYNVGLIDPAMESSYQVTAEHINQKINAPRSTLVESNTCTPERQPLDKMDSKTPLKYTTFVGSSGKLESLRNSVRKVLSPICSNIDTGNMSSKDQICLILFDPNTPKPQHDIQDDRVQLQVMGTPLGRFNLQSSNLKSSLVQEYLDFLNTANKEELLELKGIGQRMADYILELRETSPIQSLNDLEKIGLSSKQVNNMFGRAAKGLFD